MRMVVFGKIKKKFERLSNFQWNNRVCIREVFRMRWWFLVDNSIFHILGNCDYIRLHTEDIV